MTTTSNTRVVTVDLDTTKQALARRGDRVDIELPSGDVARGKISSVGKVATAQDSGNNGGNSGSTTSTLKVKIRLTGHPRLGDLDETPVTVRFAQETRRHVLSVPVTALLATAGGGYAVVAIESAKRRTIAVEPGLSAGGYVEVSGAGVRAGMRVVDAAGE
jgi:multidrug efflux pump subunit AcrA (membrane-fusion protein)